MKLLCFVAFHLFFLATFCQSCAPGTYLFTNGSCIDCSFPLVPRIIYDVPTCLNPCTDPFFPIIYPDGRCGNVCYFPLIAISNPGVGFCVSPCPDQDLYSNGTCMPCTLPFLQVDVLGIKMCNNPCPTYGNIYLHADGTCKSTCPSPLLIKAEPGVNFCLHPCDSSAPYLFDNGECSAQCNPPLLPRTDGNSFLYCENPCFASGTFLNPNGSCYGTCEEPLVQTTENGVKYCKNPCLDSSDYLYSNKSCSSQCPYPLADRVEPAAKYCFLPCDDGLYYYENGSCLENCNAPYVKSKTYNVDQCLSPCENPNKQYFYEAEKVCKANCPSPHEYKIMDGVKVCSQKPQMALKEEAEKIVSLIKSQERVTEAGMKTVSAVSSGKPNFAWLAGQASMLFYIRYINLNYTPKLKLVFFLQDVDPFDFTVGMEIPKALEKKLKNQELPEIFEIYEVQSNFLSNSWDMLSSFLLVLGMILALSLVKIFTGKYSRINKILAGVLASLKWNTLLMVVLGNFGQIYFDASLQIQAGSVDSAWEIVSLAFAVVAILAGLAMFALGVKIIKDIWKSRDEASRLEETEKKWKNFELFFENYKRTSLASFGCMMIFLGRSLIFNLIIANLYKYPLAQSVLINIVTLGMAGYLANLRPLKDTLEFAQIFLNEILVVIVNICTLIIAIMDQAKIRGEELRNEVCDAVIIIIYVFTSLNLAFLVIQILVALRMFVRVLRDLKAKGKLSPSGIVNALIFDEKEESVGIQSKKDNIVQIHPQEKSMKESKLQISEEMDIIDNTVPQNSRNNNQSLSYLDRSAVEMIPINGSLFHHQPLGVSSDLILERSRGLTLESSDRDSFAVEEKKEVSLPGTIAQFRKMRNYLRRNQDRKAQE